MFDSILLAFMQVLFPLTNLKLDISKYMVRPARLILSARTFQPLHLYEHLFIVFCKSANSLLISERLQIKILKFIKELNILQT